MFEIDNLELTKFQVQNLENAINHLNYNIDINIIEIGEEYYKVSFGFPTLDVLYHTAFLAGVLSQLNIEGKTL